MSEWLDEPSKGEFEHVGYKCLVLRHDVLGHLCGYVAMPKGHLCYGKDFERIPYEDLFPVRAHGGLTFSREGDGEYFPEGYWWLGFDCAHAWDVVPHMPFTFPDGRYRNFQYVKQETMDLAVQLATLEFIDWQFCWVWPFLLPAKLAHRIWSNRLPEEARCLMRDYIQRRKQCQYGKL